MNTVSTSWSWPRISSGLTGCLRAPARWAQCPRTRRTGATEIRLRGHQFPGVDPIWHYGFLFSPALTVGGGTFVIQRNIIGELVLGLPREPKADR